MEDLLIKLSDWSAFYGLKILGALAIFIIGRIVIGIIVGTFGKIMTRSEADQTLIKFLKSVIRAILLTVLVMMALSNLGVHTNSFIAIIGAAGLAVALAFQGSLANIASGILIIIFRPFKSGDFIEAGGSSGVVEEITVFTTMMKTPDNKQVIIPNSNVTGSNIINYSTKDMRRVDMVFGIGYDDNIKQAKETLEQILREDSRILDDPAPVVAVSELADSSVNFVVRPWVKTSDYWVVYFGVTEKVKLTFDEKSISIPYPQKDIHLHQIQTTV